MSLWYRSGTVAVTAGSRNVVGTGTEWIANCRVGDGLRVSDGTVLEIAAITSDTAITLAEDYTGATGSGLPYAVIPTRGVLKEARDAFAAALAAFGAAEDGPLLGRFAAGTVAEPGIADKDNIGTGIFFPAPGQIGVGTNGIQRALFSSTALQLDVKTKIGADLFQADPATGRVGVGTTAPTGILEVNSSRQFDPTDANSNSHLNIVQAGGTPGEGNYGASVVLSKIASGRPGGAMASVQTGADPDQMGLSFFTHLSSTASDILLEQFRIGHTGEMLARVWEGVCAASGLGAPMEEGSNANGQYFRFASGLQICLVTGLTEFASNTLECSFNGSYPAAFLAGTDIYKVASIMDNRAHADITFTSDMDSSCEVFSRYDTDHSNASFFLRVRAPSGTFTTGVSRTKIQAIFAGRWK
ncbi:MAG: hypothetical protein MRY77_15510 [Rhodobacteraceae bacterium]|nr:hypothetical protein [Paracoccaceae bacterium]